MKKQIAFLFLLVMLLLPGSATLSPAADDHVRVLTVHEIEGICRCAVGKVVTHSENAMLPGDLNYLDPAGDKILSIRFESAVQYHASKSGLRNSVAEEIAEVGDEAFLGPVRSRGVPNVLMVRKAGHSIRLCSGITENRYENRLTKEQLIAIAKIIAARI